MWLNEAREFFNKPNKGRVLKKFLSTYPLVIFVHSSKIDLELLRKLSRQYASISINEFEIFLDLEYRINLTFIGRRH